MTPQVFLTNTNQMAAPNSMASFTFSLETQCYMCMCFCGILGNRLSQIPSIRLVFLLFLPSLRVVLQNTFVRIQNVVRGSFGMPAVPVPLQDFTLTDRCIILHVQYRPTRHSHICTFYCENNVRNKAIVYMVLLYWVHQGVRIYHLFCIDFIVYKFVFFVFLFHNYNLCFKSSPC